MGFEKIYTTTELCKLPFDNQESGLKLWSSVMIVPCDRWEENLDFCNFVIVGCDRAGKPIAKVAYCDVADIQNGIPTIDVIANGVVRIHDIGWRLIKVYNNSSVTIQITTNT